MAARKARMTDKERVKALLRHERPDRVPLWPFAPAGFCSIYTKTTIADVYNKPDISLAAQRKTAQDFGWVSAPKLGYAAMGAWEFGGDIKWPSGQFAQAPTIARHPVETEEDVWKLKIPTDVAKAGIVPLMTELATLSSIEVLDNKPFKVYVSSGGAFTHAGNICKIENLCKWLLKKPKTAHRILELATEFLIALADHWKNKFGTEDVLLSATVEPSTSNQLISPKQFEEFALPYDKKIAESALAMGFKHIYTHICGDQNLNLRHWAQIDFGNPGIISIGHEIELETAGKTFPHDIIVGNLEPAIIQTRTPDEVYEATKKNIQDGMTKCPGGYIFSPGCELPPKAPLENVMTMTRAVNDFGWYE